MASLSVLEHRYLMRFKHSVTSAPYPPQADQNFQQVWPRLCENLCTLLDLSSHIKLCDFLNLSVALTGKKKLMNLASKSFLYL